jgi:hypothetical protein
MYQNTYFHEKYAYHVRSFASLVDLLFTIQRFLDTHCFDGRFDTFRLIGKFLFALCKKLNVARSAFAHVLSCVLFLLLIHPHMLSSALSVFGGGGCLGFFSLGRFLSE